MRRKAGRPPPGASPFPGSDLDCTVARELGLPLEAVLAMHPTERHLVWPSYLRRNPASLGETRILWMLARLCALVHGRTRVKDEKALAPRDFLEGLLPLPPRREPSMWDGVMDGIIARLKAEHRAKQGSAAQDGGTGGTDAEGAGTLPTPQAPALTGGHTPPQAAQEAHDG